MKLVIYNKQNSQQVGQRNGERTLRFNRENGIIYISKSFAAELGIKDMKKIQRTGLFAKLIANKAFLSSTTKAVFAL